jgi:hypothetical protein
MAMDVLLIREGTGLGAADPISHELIQRIKHGETVTAELRRQRNPKHHRMWWALVAAIYPHQTTYTDMKDLNNAIKIAVGHFESGKTIDGLPWVSPKSISYAAMDQTAFASFFDRAVEIVLTRIVPSVSRVDLETQIQEILDGQQQTA